MAGALHTKAVKGAQITAQAASEPAAPKAAAPAVDLKDRRAVITQYMPYVRSIAGRVKKNLAANIEYDDLIEYGVIGLLEASERFEPGHNANFMTFAFYRIRGAMYDGLRGMGWLRRTEYARYRFEERANAYLEEAAKDLAEGKAPEGADGPPPKSDFEHAVRDLAAAVHGLAAIYVTTLDSAELQSLPDERTPATEDVLQTEQTRALVRAALKRLGDKERQLLEMYYYKDMNLQQIGDELGVSKSWASRMHARVVDKLHRLLADSLPDGA